MGEHGVSERNGKKLVVELLHGLLLVPGLLRGRRRGPEAGEGGEEAEAEGSKAAENRNLKN